MTFSRIPPYGPLPIAFSKPIMSHEPMPRAVVLFLLAGALISPIVFCVILVLSALLRAMGDSIGAQVLIYTAWGAGIVWATSLIALVLVLAIQFCYETHEKNSRSTEDGTHRE